MKPTLNKSHNKPIKTKFQPTRWTLEYAGSEFGMDNQTLAKRMKAASIEPGEDGKFSTRQISCAVFGDIEGAKLRKETALAEKAERENRIGEGSVIPKDEVTKFIRNTFQPVREMVLALPGIAARVNPTTPEIARSELQIWVDQFLTKAKENLP